MIIVDQSGSMCCAGPINDPDEWRIVVTKLFVDFFGVDQTDADYRLGMVFFGSDCQFNITVEPSKRTER